jgi:hypothetical protein
MGGSEELRGARGPARRPGGGWIWLGVAGSGRLRPISVNPRPLRFLSVFGAEARRGSERTAPRERGLCWGDSRGGLTGIDLGWIQPPPAAEAGARRSSARSAGSRPSSSASTSPGRAELLGGALVLIAMADDSDGGDIEQLLGRADCELGAGCGIEQRQGDVGDIKQLPGRAKRQLDAGTVEYASRSTMC